MMVFSRLMRMLGAEGQGLCGFHCQRLLSQDEQPLPEAPRHEVQHKINCSAGQIARLFTGTEAALCYYLGKKLRVLLER